MDPKVALCVPTYNAGKCWEHWIKMLKSQSRYPDEVLIIDSSSIDNTVKTALKYDLSSHVIPKEEFNHGATRQLCIEKLSNPDIVIFMTQDAILASENAIENLVNCFKDENVGAAYGRQLPRMEARQIEAHARIFNYPNESMVKQKKDIPQLGVKAAFLSNSFAAYRRKALQDIGGFPSSTILAEDMYVAAKLLLKDWKIAYNSNSTVYHSHDYTFVEEFKRYFDLGVFQARESWIRKNFGGAGGEGLKFVISEQKYLLANKPSLIPSAIMRTIFKYIGFKLGLYEKILPNKVKHNISMHKSFWKIRKQKSEA